MFANPKNKLQDIANKLDISLRTLKGYKAEFKKVQFTNQVVPPSIPKGASKLQNQDIKIDNYLADTFLLIQEEEYIENIPIGTSNTVLDP